MSVSFIQFLGIDLVAMVYYGILQKLLEFLTKVENRFVNLGPIGAEQLRRFKDDVDPNKIYSLFIWQNEQNLNNWNSQCRDLF